MVWEKENVLFGFSTSIWNLILTGSEGDSTKFLRGRVVVEGFPYEDGREFEVTYHNVLSGSSTHLNPNVFGKKSEADAFAKKWMKEHPKGV